MKPIFEYHTGGKKYLGFADGNMTIEDSPYGNVDIVVNRAMPILDMLYGIAHKHNESAVIEIIRQYYPDHFTINQQ